MIIVDVCILNVPMQTSKLIFVRKLSTFVNYNIYYKDSKTTVNSKTQAYAYTIF